MKSCPENSLRRSDDLETDADPDADADADDGGLIR
ncbi:hypothetical protein LINPERPRIM_LOCUS9645 [Linum perenne]